MHWPTACPGYPITYSICDLGPKNLLVSQMFWKQSPQLYMVWVRQLLRIKCRLYAKGVPLGHTSEIGSFFGWELSGLSQPLQLSASTTQVFRALFLFSSGFCVATSGGLPTMCEQMVVLLKGHSGNRTMTKQCNMTDIDEAESKQLHYRQCDPFEGKCLFLKLLLKSKTYSQQTILRSSKVFWCSIFRNRALWPNG